MMTFSLKRVSAIVRKEYMDLMKNYQMVIMLVFPLAYALFYKRMGMEPAGIASMCIMMTLVFLTTFLQANAIAEEKEKETLRGLMLSPAGVLDVLAGKSFLTSVLTVVVSTFCLILAEVSVNINVAIVVCIGLLLFVCMGTLFGLLAQSVSALNTMMMPVIMVLMLGSMFTKGVENELVRMIVSNFPSTRIIDSVNLAVAGSGMNDLMTHILVLTGWFVGLLVACIVVYRQKRFD
ncbi:ABC transporter permease [Priestia taiwanensis]|uniref:ABC transporter permease n=1 Tax=Priestia taiwanensis TaxID=1347902 RepID=A0A917AW51_9BACI|nr:ABC transporter permease [Priestia taiwanensis]MBM7364410.1 ABC-2 type transport system permease protein [Priestia taiwanensis]GGE81639.1 ABC transporter permease [Priestia taiwanensis]